MKRLSMSPCQRSIKRLVVTGSLFCGSFFASSFTLRLTRADAQSSQPLAFPSAQLAAHWIFTSVPLDEARFSASFKQSLPTTKVDSLIAQRLARYGAFVRVDPMSAPSSPNSPRAGDFLVTLERGQIPVTIALDAQGLIAGLFLRPARVAALDVSAVSAALNALPGKTSAFVEAEGKTLLGVRENDPLGVASAFKLLILEALEKRVKEGHVRWDDVLRLAEGDKSLPSGKLQNWPTGSALTLETLATLMISESDNTATDALLRFLGPETLENLSPRNSPFLTTRQAFVLKATSNTPLLERYRAAANLKQRRSILFEADALPRPLSDAFGSDVRALDVEWFLTTRALCGSLQQTAHLALTRISPGVAVRDDWKEVAYKGGSEGGVLNLTTHVVSKTGRRACVSLTWNHTELLDEERLVDLNTAILEGLKAKLNSGG